MSTDTKPDPVEYEIILAPRGPKACEWKLRPKGGGVPKAMGVEASSAKAEQAAKRAMERVMARQG